jgi:[acyl-carrier-protein] S-malonyltransferase
MTETIAVVFPGQGSQGVGMGQALAGAYPSARATFAEADDCLGFALTKLCFEGPEETLNDTYHTQPAIFVTSIAAWRALRSAGWSAQPAFAAGHSLGEFSALVASGALSFADGLRLVRERGRLMKAAGERNPGGMAAVLQLDVQKLTDICKQASLETGRIVQVANYNSPGQVVISGDLAALDKAGQLAQAAGARRVTRLAVSIAAHSPLMTVIVDEFRQAVHRTPIQAPQLAVVANVTARPLSDVDAIRQEMVAQLTASVRWVESVEYMAAHGVTRFVEIGPKEVLTGLIPRVNKSLKVNACGTPAGLQAVLEAPVA